MSSVWNVLWGTHSSNFKSYSSVKSQLTWCFCQMIYPSAFGIINLLLPTTQKFRIWGIPYNFLPCNLFIWYHILDWPLEDMNHALWVFYAPMCLVCTEWFTIYLFTNMRRPSFPIAFLETFCFPDSCRHCCFLEALCWHLPNSFHCSKTHCLGGEKAHTTYIQV